MKQRVALLLAAGDSGLFDGGNFRDLTRELLIEQLPASATRQLGGDQAATGPVFTLYGDNPEHNPPPRPAFPA